MKICAVDASTLVAGVALMEDEHLIYEANLVHGLTHSQKLMPLVEAAFSAAGWTPGQVDVFGAVNGPGSFTGLRIGVSTVKGLAKAAGRPVAAVSTLAVLAANLEGARETVVPILDARREQVYTAAFRGAEQLLPDQALPLAELLPLLEGDCVFLGDGVAAFRPMIEEKMGPRARFAPPWLMLQHAGAAAELIRRKALAGALMEADALTPAYLRESSARKAAWK